MLICICASPFVCKGSINGENSAEETSYITAVTRKGVLKTYCLSCHLFSYWKLRAVHHNVVSKTLVEEIATMNIGGYCLCGIVALFFATYTIMPDERRKPIPPMLAVLISRAIAEFASSNRNSN